MKEDPVLVVIGIFLAWLVAFIVIVIIYATAHGNYTPLVGLILASPVMFWLWKHRDS